jgi:hypothetical protein
MNRDAKKWVFAALLVIVPFIMTGCIVWEDCWWCDHGSRPPRNTSVRAYVYDYYTGAPLTWGFVEVYEDDWWSWDYIGTWGVGPYGYTTIGLGYVYYDGYGGCEEREYRVEAFADGYHSEWVDIRLSYYDTHDTIYFYLAPWYRTDGPPGTGSDVGSKAQGESSGRGSVSVGEPRESAEAPVE